MDPGYRFLLLIPVGFVLVLALYRLAGGRALTRRTVDIVLAVLLGVYFAATASLGIFWVANQHLPVFDLHYLFGYLTLVLVIVHVAFNWQVLMGFFRKRSPKALMEEGTRRWRPALTTVAWMVGLALYGGVFYWIGQGQAGSRIEITRVRSTATEAAAAQIPDAQGPVMPEISPANPIEHQMVTVEGEKMQRTLADYYHQKTKHTRISVARDSGGLNWSTKPNVFKDYPDAEVIDLPKPAESAGMSVGAAIEACRRPVHGFGADAATLADVSTMLFMTNGITSTLRYPDRTYYLRAAPSAGALYPTVTYVFARNVEGLPAGIYHYVVDRHKLHRLRPDAESSEELASLVARGRLVRDAPVTFVFTSAFYRSAWKYRERSYRYCCLDAGHLAVQTSLAAAALGYGSSPIGRFDDAKVNALLDLTEPEEGAMLVLPVGVVCEERPVPAGELEFALAPKDLASRSDPLLLLIHGSTNLGLTGATVRPLPSTEPVGKAYDGLPVVELPRALPGGDDLFTTISRRRSIREWADPGMSLVEFSAVMYYAFSSAQDSGSLLCDPGVGRNRALNLYVIVNRIDELEAGVYYYRRYDHALSEIRRGEHRGRSYAASLFQDAVGNADAALVMTVDLQRLGRPDGDRGYRYAGLNAGMLGGRVYLQTTGLELGCCGIGAYFDDEVSDLIGVSPEKELVIYLAAIGAREPGAER